MGGAGWGGVWLVIVPLLPCLAYLCALIWQNRPWSTREIPASVWRYVAGMAFAWWVAPWLGVLATISTYHWARGGWTLAGGGTFWPTVAMATLLVWQTPPWVVHALLASCLAMGALQSVLGMLQFFRLPWAPFFLPGIGSHGTIGHRTGLGIYLAILTPLAFLTDYGWPLALIYMAGIACARTTVAVGAFVAGLAVVQPWVLWLAPLAPLLALGRLVERHAPGVDLSDRWHLGRWCLQPIAWSPPGRARDDSWALRWGIWRGTWIEATRSWRTILFGHGAGTFRQHARRWMGRYQLREIYEEAHNDYLEKFYEYGAMGAVAGALILMALWPSLGLTPWTGMLVAFAVAMLANFPLSVAPIAGLAWLVVAHLTR